LCNWPLKGASVAKRSELIVWVFADDRFAPVQVGHYQGDGEVVAEVATIAITRYVGASRNPWM
jgi:hypothetical protein